MSRLQTFEGLLRDYESSNAIIGEIDNEHDVQRRMKLIFGENKDFRSNRTFNAVPTFFKSPIAAGNEDILQARMMLADISRHRFMAKQNDGLQIFEDEQEQIQQQILTKSTPHYLDDESTAPIFEGTCSDIEKARIDYEGFCELRENSLFHHPMVSKILSTEIFLMYRRDRWGRISSAGLMNHIRFEFWYRRQRLELNQFDAQDSGFLNDNELQNYIRHLVSTSPVLSHALSDMLEGQDRLFFYLITAAQKFLFFLDPKKTWKIAIKDILASSILRELSDAVYGEGDGLSESNWFSPSSFVRVYNLYLDMDCEKKGMLSKENFASYRSAYGEKTLTTVFIDRIFSECLTYEGEVDYKTFLEFVLAMEHKKDNKVSLTYFFRLLDVRKHGYLDRFTLSYFFREVADRLSFTDDIKVDDVIDEIFDMCKPKVSSIITLNDLLSCGQGHVVIDILTDVSGFWSYDTRESRNSGDTTE